MYWKNQEKDICGIIFILVVGIQTMSFFALREFYLETQFFWVTGFNVVLFLSLIYYAKWFCQVILYPQIVYNPGDNTRSCG